MDPANRRQLEYFLAVADSGSMSRAAKALGMSQPSLSEAINALELHFGASLFQRLPAGVELTSAGRELMGPAAQVLRSFEAAEASVGPVREKKAGRLSIVCPPTLAQDPLAGMIGRFRKTYPPVFISVSRPKRWSQVGRFVLNGKAELAVTVEQHVPRDLVVEPFIEQVLTALVPPTAAVEDGVDLETLLACGLVTTPRGGVTRRALEQHLGESLVSAAVTVETLHQGSMIPLVLAGLGVALVPQSQANEAAALGIRSVSTRPVLTRKLVIAYREGWLSPAGSAFLDIAREMTASHLERVERGTTNGDGPNA